MIVKKNPLKLNPLQLRTLALFQELARHPGSASPVPQTDDIFVSQLPHPHGDHFHIGAKVALTSDATGLQNPSVWVALERKGLIRSGFPYALTLTKAGQDYDTSGAITLYGSDH